LLDYAKEKKMGDIITWLELAKKFEGKVDKADMDPSENTGWVKYSFVLSMTYMLKKNVSFTNALRETLMLAGDTCVNGMLVGAILGARLGFEALPSEAVDNVLNCNMEKFKGVARPKSL
jgi:ADP-ribosylglycohydrolase